MKRTRLHFDNIQQIVGGDGLSVVLMVDENRKRVLSVVCDEQITQQIVMRVHNPKACRTYLPEVMLEMLTSRFEMMIYGIHEGQYQVVLADMDYERTVRLRMSDAVLLSIIDEDIPLYIEENLMERQSVPFDPAAKGIAIPINTMDNQRLNQALQHAIDEENYELASHLRDEILRRKEK